jgi:hypothetical protein
MIEERRRNRQDEQDVQDGRIQSFFILSKSSSW